MYGRGKTWSKDEIERLLHKLILESYLNELLFVNNEIVYGYLELGPKAQQLMTSTQQKVHYINFYLSSLRFELKN